MERRADLVLLINGLPPVLIVVDRIDFDSQTTGRPCY